MIWSWYRVIWRKKSTQENPSFTRGCFKSIFKVDLDKKYPTFTVPIGNGKKTGEIKYNPKAPLLEYHQNTLNICWFSSLASAFTETLGNNSTRDIAM